MTDIDIHDLFPEDQVDERLDAEAALNDMPFRSAAIVYLFATGHTQAEIGERVGCCQQRISQILANISKKHSETA